MTRMAFSAGKSALAVQTYESLQAFHGVINNANA
jgi:hypothetical protein